MKVQDSAARIRAALDAGETIIGCFLSLGSPLTAEIMGAAGFDCAMIDLEHGSGSERDALDQLQALAASGCPGFVRVESAERQRVHRVLDAGAHGVMFPRIETAEEARAAAAAMRYPPAGTRGVASSTRACEYGANFEPYLTGSPNLLTIIQIESETAVKNAGDIAAVDGVDVLFIGPWDLSFGMGILGQFDHPKFQTAIQNAAESARRHRKHLGILLPAGKRLNDFHAAGFRFILSGTDAVLLQQAARSAAKSLFEQRATLSRDSAGRSEIESGVRHD